MRRLIGSDAVKTPRDPWRDNRSRALWFRSRKLRKFNACRCPATGRRVSLRERDASSRGEDTMKELWRRIARAGVSAIGVWILAGATIAVAEECRNRGQLDTLYCDDDNDLVADVPSDPKKLRDPSTLVFAYTPVEDPAVYQNVFKPFTDHLAACTGKRVVYYPVNSNSAEIEAMRSGRLHVAGFSTGPTGFAVNMAGAVPFATKGTEKGVQGYRLLAIVRKDSPYQKLADLKGKRVAHTSPSSNSGNLAPRVLFPRLGLVPDKDYKVLFSGKHENSISGVAAGDFDAAPIAHDILVRMAE